MKGAILIIAGALAPCGATHYGNPAAGPCEADEQAIQITGITGGVRSCACATVSFL